MMGIEKMMEWKKKNQFQWYYYLRLGRVLFHLLSYLLLSLYLLLLL